MMNDISNSLHIALDVVKEGASVFTNNIILNAARGGLIDEDALEKSLNSGQVAGAWLDTFEKEPYTGNLSKYNQVILTPHIGSYSIEGRRQMELDSVNNLLHGFGQNSKLQ